jgi:hypothetical protein
MKAKILINELTRRREDENEEQPSIYISPFHALSGIIEQQYRDTRYNTVSSGVL